MWWRGAMKAAKLTTRGRGAILARDVPRLRRWSGEKQRVSRLNLAGGGSQAKTKQAFESYIDESTSGVFESWKIMRIPGIGVRE
jgi:hypothetical protein